MQDSENHNITPLPGHLSPAEISAKERRAVDSGDKAFSSAGTYNPITAKCEAQTEYENRKKPSKLMNSLKKLAVGILNS